MGHLAPSTIFKIICHRRRVIAVDTPLVGHCYPSHLGVLTAHGEEKEGQEVAQQRGAKSKLGGSHYVQPQLLHDHTPQEHAKGHGRDVDEAYNGVDEAWLHARSGSG